MSCRGNIGRWTCGQGVLHAISTNGMKTECRFRLDVPTFLEIVSGRLTPQNAFFKDRIHIEGDMQTGLRLAAVFGQFFRRFPFVPTQAEECGMTLLESKQLDSSHLDARMRRILRIHFDPNGGAPYWLQRQQALGIDVCDEIRTVNDLPRLGPMEEGALRRGQLKISFRSRCSIGKANTSSPKLPGRWAGRSSVFIEKMSFKRHLSIRLSSQPRIGFPREVNWLFIGPSGSSHHWQGRLRLCPCNGLARAICDRSGSTLGKRKLPPGTFGWRRYVEHVETQAMAILNSQEIGVIFSMPVVLESLGKRMSPQQIVRTRGIHLGGVSVPPQQREEFARLFPRAVILSGYGNSLFGMMPELSFSAQTGFDYYPLGMRQIARVVPRDGGSAQDRLLADVPVGERGQVVMNRIDETQLIVNLMERDEAERLARCSAWAAADGFVTGGLRDPRPIVNETMKPAWDSTDGCNRDHPGTRAIPEKKVALPECWPIPRTIHRTLRCCFARHIQTSPATWRTM